MVIHMIVVLLLTLIPIGYGVFLLYCKINPYKVSILGPKEFRWFQSFNIFNCSVQVLFGLTLFLSIFVTLKQLRQNGFKKGLATGRTMLMAAGFLLYAVTNILIVVSYGNLHSSQVSSEQMHNLKVTLVLWTAAVYVSFIQ